MKGIDSVVAFRREATVPSNSDTLRRTKGDFPTEDCAGTEYNNAERNLIQRPDQPRPATAFTTERPKLVSYSPRRFMTPTRENVRGNISSSPLAQYDNGKDFASFFGVNSSARVYRTPISTSHFCIGDRPIAERDLHPRRASYQSSSAVWHSLDVDHPTSPRHFQSHHQMQFRGSSRKSSLRTRRYLNDKTARTNLRVSFEESSHPEKDKQNEGHVFSRLPQATRTLQLTSRSNQNVQYRRHTIASLVPPATPHTRAQIQSVNLIPKPKTRLTIATAPGNEDSSTSSSRPSMSTSVEGTNRRGNLRSSAPPNINTRTLHYIPMSKQSESESRYKSVLTSDQLLVRSSVEKVQRWIEKLPRHFTTIHHLLPPVQQNY